MASNPKVRFPATDIWDCPDDGKIYEVIDGELYVSPAPDWFHQLAVGALFAYIWNHVRAHGLGKVVPAPTGVVLTEHDGVEPDIVYVSNERAGIISRRGVEGAPDLVVEVLSPSTRDRDLGLKMRRYAAAGVPHYWVVDPEAGTLTAYRLEGSAYRSTGVYGTGATFRPDLFPGLAIPIDELWA